MKKLFQFLKSLFVKLDILEDKVEKAVADSKLLSEEQKKKIKENLDKFDKIEENVEDVVEKAEIAAEKVIDVVEHKKLESVGDAIN
jgi:mevalonate kinase